MLFCNFPVTLVYMRHPKSLQVSRTFLSILANQNNPEVKIVTILRLISFLFLFYSLFWSAVTFMFHCFFSSLARSKYLSIFSLSFLFTFLVCCHFLVPLLFQLLSKIQVVVFLFSFFPIHFFSLLLLSCSTAFSALKQDPSSCLSLLFLFYSIFGLLSLSRSTAFSALRQDPSICLSFLFLCLLSSLSFIFAHWSIGMAKSTR